MSIPINYYSTIARSHEPPQLQAELVYTEAYFYSPFIRSTFLLFSSSLILRVAMTLLVVLDVFGWQLSVCSNLL